MTERKTSPQRIHPVREKAKEKARPKVKQIYVRSTGNIWHTHTLTSKRFILHRHHRFLSSTRHIGDVGQHQLHSDFDSINKSTLERVWNVSRTLSVATEQQKNTPCHLPPLFP